MVWAFHLEKALGVRHRFCWASLNPMPLVVDATLSYLVDAAISVFAALGSD